MGGLSVWHWLIVLVVVALLFAQARLAARKLSTDGGGNLAHSITAYVVAALHDGALSAQATIDRLSDRHRARLPELGLKTEIVLKEARKARTRNHAFGAAYFAASLWLLDRLLAFPLIEQDELTLAEYINSLITPLFAISALTFLKTLIVNRYIRSGLPNIDEPITLGFAENVIIFGGFSPFAGFGDDLDSWSFTVNVNKPPDGASDSPTPFTHAELLDHVDQRFQHNISGALRSDLFFVSGRHIRNRAKFLKDYKATPTSTLAVDDIRPEVAKLESTWRHYRALTVPISEGHLALNFFLRSSNVGDNIFIESRCFILSPIRPEYTSLNDLPTRTGPGYLYRLARRSILLSPFSWVTGSLEFFHAVSRIASHVRWSVLGHPEDKLKKRDILYNYGHSRSFRESLASNTYQTYFQMIDKDRIVKTVQYITLNSIVDFLDAHGVATDEIKERRSQIFNSGVIVSGGVLNTQQLAVGPDAKAKITSVISSVKPKGVPDAK